MATSNLTRRESHRESLTEEVAGRLDTAAPTVGGRGSLISVATDDKVPFVDHEAKEALDALASRTPAWQRNALKALVAAAGVLLVVAGVHGGFGSSRGSSESAPRSRRSATSSAPAGAPSKSAGRRAYSAASRCSTIRSRMYDFNHDIYTKAGQEQELKTKMLKMSGSPFVFYRGTAHLFFQDVTTAAWDSAWRTGNTDKAWVEGDFHIANLGAFEDENDKVVFDVTDYDEGYLGSYMHDVRRLAASIYLAARDPLIPSNKKLSASDIADVINKFTLEYKEALDIWNTNDDEMSTKLTEADTSDKVKDTIQAAAGNTREKYLNKYSSDTGSTREFTIDSTPYVDDGGSRLQPVSSSWHSKIKAAVESGGACNNGYKTASYWKVKDIAQRFGSGTGSLGRPRFWILIEGNDSGEKDDRLIQMKMEVKSAVEAAHPGNLAKSTYGTEGCRVVETYKAFVKHADDHIGCCQITEGGYTYNMFLQERMPKREGFDFLTLDTKSEWMDMAKDAGLIVAKVHSRSDKDNNPIWTPNINMDDEIYDIIKGSNTNNWQEEVLEFAEAYGAQVEADYDCFKTWYTANSGNLKGTLF